MPTQNLPFCLLSCFQYRIYIATDTESHINIYTFASRRIRYIYVLNEIKVKPKSFCIQFQNCGEGRDGVKTMLEQTKCYLQHAPHDMAPLRQNFSQIVTYIYIFNMALPRCSTHPFLDVPRRSSPHPSPLALIAFFQSTRMRRCKHYLNIYVYYHSTEHFQEKKNDATQKYIQKNIFKIVVSSPFVFRLIQLYLCVPQYVWVFWINIYISHNSVQLAQRQKYNLFISIW